MCDDSTVWEVYGLRVNTTRPHTEGLLGNVSKETKIYFTPQLCDERTSIPLTVIDVFYIHSVATHSS